MPTRRVVYYLLTSLLLTYLLLIEPIAGRVFFFFFFFIAGEDGLDLLPPTHNLLLPVQPAWRGIRHSSSSSVRWRSL